MSRPISTPIVLAKPSAATLEKRLASGHYRMIEGQLEKRCRGMCQSYWPADSEFFYSNKNHPDGLGEICKACYVETRFPEGRPSVAQEVHA